MDTPVKLIPGLPAGTPVADRVAHGQAAAERHPIEAMGDWSPPADRPSAVDLLVGQESSRVPQLLPIRHARMAVSPFTFYRGSAIVMASDLGRSANSDLWAQLCGDAHLSNFGVFGTPERNLIFDINDFDETAPGPFEWDVMRLAASFVLAGRDNGYPKKVSTLLASLAAQAYQTAITNLAAEPYIDNWYAMITPELILQVARGEKLEQKESKSKGKGKGKAKGKGKSAGSDKPDARRMNKALTKIRSRDAWSAIRKLTEKGPDGRRRFRNDPPLLVRLADLPVATGLSEEVFVKLWQGFLDTMPPDRQALLSRYTLLDMAHKVVGVGSVGLPALVGLLQGRDENDLMTLQFKAAQASVLEEWTRPSPFSEHGERVVVGQRIMQATGDPFLGWVTGPGDYDFYGRQLRDFKWSVDLNGLRSDRMEGYAMLCGGTLAMAHARAGDPIAISSYLATSSEFGNALSRFSNTYADLVDEDYKAFTAAIADGKLTVADGVQ